MVQLGLAGRIGIIFYRNLLLRMAPGPNLQLGLKAPIIKTALIT